MIKDDIKNAEKYYSLHSDFKKAFEFLKNGTWVFGKNELDDKNYVNVQEYITKSLDAAKPEAHRKYIDIQFMIKGKERIGICDIEKTKPDVPYDEKTDLEFLSSDEIDFITLDEGEFVIFYPNDVHMPSLELKTASNVIKAVAKIFI